MTALAVAKPVPTPFRVTLKENPEDSFTIVWYCLAETSEDAFDMAEDEYPGHHMLTASPDYDLSRDEIQALMS